MRSRGSRRCRSLRTFARRRALAFGLALAVTGACGGGNGGGDTPTAPADNTVFRVDIVPATSIALASGTSSTLSAQPFTRDGRLLTGQVVSWSTSDSTVASVLNGLVTARLVGTAQIGARVGSVSASTVAVTVSPGAATQLAFRTQPVAATAYAVFPTPAVVEVRDATGNVVTASVATVTAALTSGSGALGGTVAVAATAGVATFSSLTVEGPSGTCVLTFSSPGLLTASSVSFSVAAAPPGVISFAPATATLAALAGGSSAPVVVNVTNGGVAPLSSLSMQGVAYAAGQPAGWLTAILAAGTAPTTLTLTASAAGLGIGTYNATVQVAGVGASVSPVALPVVLQVGASLTISYGTAANKTSIVNPGASVAPEVSVVNSSTGAPAQDPTLGFVSRAPSVATVDAAGRVTGVDAGATWVVATSQSGRGDSVFVLVARSAAAPIFRTDLTQYAFRPGDTITVSIILDTRGATRLGAITATVSWTNDNTTGVLSLLDVSMANSTMVPVVASDAAIGVIRLTAASTTGVAGVVELVRVRWVARTAGRTGWIYLNATELLASDFTDLLPTTTLTQYPVIIR